MRRSAWSCWKTLVWFTQIIPEAYCSHDGKSSVSPSGMIDPYVRIIVLLIFISSYYEGHSIRDITFPVRLLHRLGVKTIIGATVSLLFVLIY